MPDPIFGGAFDTSYGPGAVIPVGLGDYVVADSDYKSGLAWIIAGSDHVGRFIRLPAIRKMSKWWSDPANSAACLIKCGASTVSIAPGELAYVTTDGSANGIFKEVVEGGSGGGGGGSISWVGVAVDTDAAAGDALDVDTAAGVVTVTLPATPDTFAQVSFRNSAQSFGTHALTIARNGETIMGLTEDMTVNTDGVDFSLWFNGTTWQFPGAQL